MAKSYRTLVFRLRALTNLHAGSGDSFYGAVDKLVQRDAATNRPVIHSHSLKGALREFFEQEGTSLNGFTNRVFGTPVDGRPEDARPGAYRFFSAELLALPVPEEDPAKSEAYHLATDDDVISEVQKRFESLGWKTKDFKLAVQGNGPNLKSNLAERFREGVLELPVVARNCLDNGKSVNLWYEEFVPRESVFVFAIQVDDDAAEFLSGLRHKVIQIGANATVGYGYCEITLL